MSRILLVRHGQASFGTEDYDRLSEQGVRQSRLLGAALAGRGVVPDRLVSGGMRRHQQTCAAMTAAAGWAAMSLTDAGWDEFDSDHVLSRVEPPSADPRERVAFQHWFQTATTRWTTGEHDHEYDEPFGHFAARVDQALRRLTDALGRGETAVVITSGGPIAWVAATLLADAHAVRAGLWHRLNLVCANTGVETVVVGGRGTTLLTLNEHAHLPRDLVTYR